MRGSNVVAIKHVLYFRSLECIETPKSLSLYLQGIICRPIYTHLEITRSINDSMVCNGGPTIILALQTTWASTLYITSNTESGGVYQEIEKVFEVLYTDRELTMGHSGEVESCWWFMVFRSWREGASYPRPTSI